VPRSSIAATPVPELAVDLVERPADRGAELSLLGHELGNQVGGRRGLRCCLVAVGAVVLLDVLPLAPPRGHLEGVGTERYRDAGPIHHRQLFLDPDRPHRTIVGNGIRLRDSNGRASTVRVL
jgi:hypothetical protein